MSLTAAARKLAAHSETAELGREALERLTTEIPIRHCVICGGLMPQDAGFQAKGRPRTVCSDRCRRIRACQYARVQYHRQKRLLVMGRQVEARRRIVDGTA